MKKYTIILLAVISFSFISKEEKDMFQYNGNTVFLSEKMIEHYSEEFILNLKHKNVELLLYLNFYSTNAFEVVNVGEKLPFLDLKLKDFNKIEKSLCKDFDPRDIQSFNILAYDIVLLDKQQFINVGNLEFAIKVLSKKDLIEKFNKYKASLLLK